MPESFDLVIKLILAFFVLLIGLAAFIGGLKRKPKPFFWTSDNTWTYLKTSTHYVIFGAISILAALFFIGRIFIALHVF